MLEPDSHLEEVFETAMKLASDAKHEYVTVEHFTYALILNEEFSKVLDDFGADRENMGKELSTYLGEKLKDIVTDKKVRPLKTQALERVLNRAFTQTLFSGRTNISPSDVFLSILNEKKSFSAFLMKKYKIDKEKFSNFIETEAIIGEAASADFNRTQLERVITSFCTNLTAKAKQGKIDPVIGRGKEIKETIQSHDKKQM